MQDILDNYANRTNKSGNFDALSDFIKCNDCKGQMISKTGENKSYYYCTNYFKKKCTSHSIEKTKLERMILEELNVDEIIRNNLYKKENVIYIKDNKTISIDYK